MTTDFFDTTLKQCQEYAAILRKYAADPDATSLADKLDAAAAECDSRSKSGKDRASMAAAVAMLPGLVAAYAKMQPSMKASFDTEQKAAAPAAPK